MTTGLANPRVLSASGRAVRLLMPDGSTLAATATSKAHLLTVGDEVQLGAGAEPVVRGVHPARNEIARSYRGETRRVAANVDLLFVMAAVPSLFNPAFIDRILAVAHVQNIPAVLLLNKIDLGIDGCRTLLSVYEALDVPVVAISAKRGDGVGEVRARLADAGLSLAVLAGMSGVGKSTLLKVLIPGIERTTSHVSARTGQGRQTTTLSEGFLYERAGRRPAVIADLPGIQKFGVSHLSPEETAAAFPEIAKFGAECPFRDCAHLKEEPCAVRDAVASGAIAESRYRSYAEMIDEITAVPAHERHKRTR